MASGDEEDDRRWRFRHQMESGRSAATTRDPNLQSAADNFAVVELSLDSHGMPSFLSLGHEGCPRTGERIKDITTTRGHPLKFAHQLCRLTGEMELVALANGYRVAAGDLRSLDTPFGKKLIIEAMRWTANAN